VNFACIQHHSSRSLRAPLEQHRLGPRLSEFRTLAPTHALRGLAIRLRVDSSAHDASSSSSSRSQGSAMAPRDAPARLSQAAQASLALALSAMPF